MTPTHKPIEAAGGLIVDRKSRVLFIYKDRRWDLPKGLLEGKREALPTALREIAEETGIDADKLELVDELIPTHHLSKYRKNRYLKRTRWFLFRYPETAAEFEPQSEEGIEHCRWIAPWEFDRVYRNCPSRVRYLIEFWDKARRFYD